MGQVDIDDQAANHLYNPFNPCMVMVYLPIFGRFMVKSRYFIPYMEPMGKNVVKIDLTTFSY